MVTYRVIQNDVGCFDLTSRNGVSINGKNLANKKIQLNENKRMLVQTFKAKRPRYPSVKDSGKKFFPTTSDNSDDIEMTDMQQQWQQTSFVDQKYRDFHRKRRSEKVLKIINSMMTHSQSDMQKVLSNTSSLKKTRQENPTSLLSTTFPNANTDVTYKQQSNNQDEKVAADTGLQKSLQELQQENKSLRSQISSIHAYLKQNPHQEDVTEYGRDHNYDRDNILTGGSMISPGDNTYDKDFAMADTLYFNNSRRNSSSKIESMNAKKKFDNAVQKYRLEIYKKRSEDRTSIPFRDDSEVERMNALESVLFDVKLENLQERTEKEKLRLEVDRLQTCFSKLANQYTELTDAMQQKLVDNNKRLENAFDRMHNLKYNKRKKNLLNKLKK